ncbi:MAG: polyphosphate polymerase domain-containing protein, partial [Anaerolineae bacterium]|nr:polyphosphate polymerase domain-containing protein [Anaerolineae bacterium]
VLQRYDPIDLSEMGHVALLRRTDTKHLLSEEQLYQALSQLTGHYRILEIEGRRLHRYQTLYFDTQDLALYRQHHDGWRNRYKVRERAYADSGLAYLEVKHKVNAGRTVKSRIRTPTLSAEIARDARPFLHRHYPYPVEALEPALFNTFRRITLVSRHGIERVTVDLGLRFWWDGEDMSLDGVSVAEVKQDRLSAGSPFLGQMRALGVRATPFSKYCMGVCMLYPEVKYNRFKPQLRQIAMLSHEGRSACQTYN